MRDGAETREDMAAINCQRREISGVTPFLLAHITKVFIFYMHVVTCFRYYISDMYLKMYKKRGRSTYAAYLTTFDEFVLSLELCSRLSPSQYAMVLFSIDINGPIFCKLNW